MNIYPWNVYILYCAIAITIVFLVMTLVRLKPLLQELNTMNKNMDGLNAQTTTMNKKLELLPKKDPNKKSFVGAPEIFSGYMLLRAILKDQKKSGVKGQQQFRSSASKVIKKRMYNQSIQENIMKILKRR